MKVYIILDIEPEKDSAIQNGKQLIEFWLHALADSIHEVEDPNTGEVVGGFTFAWEDVIVRTEVEEL